MNRPIFGNPATTPNPVSDFNQNNPKKADYIKNRPFYESSLCICDHNEKNDYGRINPTVQMNEGITLVKGEHLLFEIIEDGKVRYDEIERLGIDGGDGFFYFKSGRFYSWEEGSNVITVQTWDKAYEISVKITRPGEVKQLDEKFIPDRIKYTYVTDKKLGENKSEDDMGIAFVNCSEEIKVGDTIKVKGYFNDGTTEEYTLTVPETYISGEFIRIGNAGGRLCEIAMPHPTVVSFQSEVKGEVYKMSKVLISDAVTEIDTALNNIIEKYGLGGDA